MINNRCSVCDWNPMGMCSNYEIDKYLSKGQPNKILYHADKKDFICLKCYNAIEDVKYDHLVKDEEESLLLLQDFSDEEIEKLEKEASKDITLDYP